MEGRDRLLSSIVDMNSISVLDLMEGKRAIISHTGEGRSDKTCSICLESLMDRGERSIANIRCGHEFHLDCIGSAFNAKGAMQCPNCRKVEKGRWLYASGNRSHADFEFDAWLARDFYDELPFGFQWCPFRGITQLASLFGEGESQLNSYHEFMGNATYGDISSASTRTHVCPYLSLHGHFRASHATAASSSVDSVPENSLFPRHPARLLGGGQPSADVMLNSNFSTNTDRQNRNWQQLHSSDQSAPGFGPRLTRNDVSSQQRLGSFVQTHPSFLGRTGLRRGSNTVPSLSTHGHSANRIYEPTVPYSSLRNPPFIPTQRSRPQGFALVSSLAATSSSADVGGSYGFASLSSSSASRSHQDPETMVAQHLDRLFGWAARDGLAPLPWVPLEGESQWWGPFNPNPTSLSGGSRPGNGHQRMPPPPSRMPSPSYM